MVLGEEKTEKRDESSLQAQLSRFDEGVKQEDWKPIVLLVEDSANLRLLAQYLTNSVGDGVDCDGRKGVSDGFGGACNGLS